MASEGWPQPWDAQKLRQAVDDIAALVDAGGQDAHDSFRPVVQRIVERRLRGDWTRPRVAAEMAYLLCATAIFAQGALPVAEQIATREELLSLIDDRLASWLEEIDGEKERF